VGKTTVIYVNFLPDVACQKLLKSADVSRSYSKNNTDSFLRHGVHAKDCDGTQLLCKYAASRFALSKTVNGVVGDRRELFYHVLSLPAEATAVLFSSSSISFSLSLY